MLSPDNLTLALDIHSRSYKLLRWLGRAMDAREICVPRISPRHTEDVTSSALDWIESIQSALPADIRPDHRALHEFAAFFGTYVTTSYDVLEHTNPVLPSGWGCYCEFCSRVINSSHLKTKKVTTADKRRATSLLIDRLCDLAKEERMSCLRHDAETLIADPDQRRATAYSAYGHWLIQRTMGITDGASILALWREIAWTRQGSPLKDFQLRYIDFVDSENLLVAILESVTRKSNAANS